MKKIIEFTIKKITKEKIDNQNDLRKIKSFISKKFKTCFPKNIDLLRAYLDLLEKKEIKKSLLIESLLRTRSVRSLSGIVNISVLTKPFPCPGKCIFCPTEKGIPKSYVSGEPAVERAKILEYDPYLQTKKRIQALESEGHVAEKVELRIVGGTWSYYPKKYRNWFVARCFQACNDLSNIKKTRNTGLKHQQQENEKAKYRIVGLSVETRPDFINEKEIKHLRNLGITMVELGIQSIYDNVLKINTRGHGVETIILATKLLKDSGFKVLYQVMPNLFNSNIVKDKKMFKELFENSDFQPDLLKIYPCAIIKGTKLYKLWRNKKYKPYTKKQLINLLKYIKLNIPFHVRIQRIIRDIPSAKISEGGSKTSNLRQLLTEKMKKENIKCRCIRCREVKEKYNPKEKLYLFKQEYLASNGKEIFLSFENKNRTKLCSMLRLRISLSEKNKIFPALKRTGIIREIHSYGPTMPIDKKNTPDYLSAQHKGLGKKLIREAENITKKQFKLKKIAVISAIGTREYFREQGYKLKSTYMVKNL